MDVDDRPAASAPVASQCTPAPLALPPLASLHALNTCLHGILVVDSAPAGAPVIYANPAACRIIGRDHACLLGASALLLDDADADADADSEQPLRALLSAALAAPGPQRALLTVPGAAPAWREILVSPVGDDRHLVCVIDDVSELHRQTAKLAYLSTHDALTGLADRSLFGACLERHCTRARHQHERCSTVRVA